MIKPLLILGILLTALWVTGCRKTESVHLQEHLLQATLWFQQSAEMKAIYFQTYNLAEHQLERNVAHGGEKPMAVVLDIDETALDNSPQSAQQILDNEAFNSEMWDEWCTKAKASPLPGAVEFTRHALKLGVEVTLRNLGEVGFPNADSTHVLLKTTTSSKDSRREMISSEYDIVMLIGDNLGDFSGIFTDRMNGHDHQSVEEYRDSFGTSFILLPNPIYGGWEKPYAGETLLETTQLKKKALKSFRN